MATPSTISASAAVAGSKDQVWQSRAVSRLVEPGNWAECALCEDVIKFRARERREQVICNVYVDGRWDRVEHYHTDCYDTAEQPYGEAAD